MGSEKNLDVNRRSLNEGNKILIQDKNFTNKPIKMIDSSIVSYKSVQKQF